MNASGLKPIVLTPLRRTVADAQRFAGTVHAGQVDKAGRPYFFHLRSVAMRVFQHSLNARKETAMRTLFEQAEQVAWLHDVVEDTPYSSADLEREGFTRDVVFAVERLTRPKFEGETYLEWICQIAASRDPLAIIVKVADLEDNSDPARLAALDVDVRVRLERKYGPALVIMREASAALGWHRPDRAPAWVAA